MNEQVNESNFILYAARHYDNPQCFSDGEFFEDLNRVKYIKRIFKKYNNTKEMNIRLVLNHMTLLNNVFGSDIFVKLLFLKLESYYDILVPFLMFLNLLPEKIDGIGADHKTIYTGRININTDIEERLRNI